MACLTGCNCLPDGKPPKGTIVDSGTAPAASLSAPAAVNKLSDALTVYGLSRLGGARLELKILDGKIFRPEIYRILQIAGSTVRFTVVNSEPDYIVTANFADPDAESGISQWNLSLAKSSDPEKVLWQRSATVNVNLQEN